jgi:hypothetical protein
LALIRSPVNGGFLNVTRTCYNLSPAFILSAILLTINRGFRYSATASLWYYLPGIVLATI